MKSSSDDCCANWRGVVSTRNRPRTHALSCSESHAQQLAQPDQLARIIDLYNHIKYGRHGDSTLLLKQMRSMIKSLQT